MNREILEFWGNVLIQIARQQKQLEDMTKWALSGMKILEAQRDFWDRMLGVTKEAGNEKDDSQQSKWEPENYKDAYRQFVKLFGLVTLDEYLELKEERDKLGKRLAERKKAKSEKVIRGKEFVEIQREIEKGLQNLLDKQSEQYQELMESVGRLYRNDNAE